MDIDLRACLERFPKICEAKFGRTYNFGAIERSFSHIRNGERWLAARDVMKVFDPNATPFARYWGPPNERDLDRALSEKRIRFAPIPENAQALIGRLLTVFHNTGLVSIILRFVHPDRFAIFSTPVINSLLIQRANTIDLYIAYCDELREWQKHFKLPSVAQTEMAIWSCDQLAKQVGDGRMASQVPPRIDSDLWIQRRRAGQVIRPFLKNNGRLELAKILVDEDPKLAGKIAAEEYERLLRSVGQRYLRRQVQLRRGDVPFLLDRLLGDGKVTLAECVDLREIWRIRNKSVHPVGKLTSAEVEKMIDSIEKFQRRWMPRSS